MSWMTGCGPYPAERPRASRAGVEAVALCPFATVRETVVPDGVIRTSCRRQLGVLVVVFAEVGGHDDRIVAHLVGRALADLTAEVEDDDVIAGAHDEVHVVLDEEDGDAPVVGESAHQAGELGRLVVAEPGRRLVEEQHAGLGGQGPGDGEKPALAIGQILHLAEQVVLQLELPDGGDDRVRERRGLRSRPDRSGSPTGLSGPRRPAGCRAPVASSKSSNVWNERLTPALALAVADMVDSSRPSSCTVPAVSRVKPVIASIAEVFPAPLGPMRPTIWPGRTARESSSTATTPP